MNIHRLQGWALIFSSAITLLKLIFMFIFLQFIFIDFMQFNKYKDILNLIGHLAFIFGLSAISYAIQPQSKRWGKVGLLLMLIPIVYSLLFLAATSIIPSGSSSEWFFEALFLIETTSASAGITYFGYLLIGWLTIRGRIFPSWIGYLLILNSFLNGITGFVSFNESQWLSTTTNGVTFMGKPDWFLLLDTLSTFIGVVALVGYGWYIIRYKTDLYDGNQIKKLEEKGDTQSLIQILEKEHQSDVFFRLSAAEVLAKIGNDQGINYLISKLQSLNIDEKESAAEILAELNIKHALPS